MGTSSKRMKKKELRKKKNVKGNLWGRAIKRGVKGKRRWKGEKVGGESNEGKPEEATGRVVFLI